MKPNPKDARINYHEASARGTKLAAIVLAIEAFAEDCDKTLAEILPTVERWQPKEWAMIATLAGKHPPSDITIPLILSALRARIARDEPSGVHETKGVVSW